ncbi:unnamed protein product [Lactuca saligna]|uniref:Uncharacterized protein n=1 Tax=Lactuca saligna TaxID=75948 RepID=A0AA36EQ59_LACSI|nr:unnamed protein product [Lactuca saligna]
MTKKSSEFPYLGEGCIESELSRCQRQLARARVDGAVARGSLKWMLEKGVVHVIDKVIKSMEFASGIQGIHNAFEALVFEKGKQLGGCSTISGESEAPEPGCGVRRTEEVDTALSSLAETDFVGLFHPGELDYDSFRQFFHRPGPGSSSSDFED